MLHKLQFQLTIR